MKLNPSETSLVIAGAWNTAILTPEWVIRNGMNLDPAAGIRIQAAVPAGFAGAFEFPRFTIADVAYTSRPDVLVINPIRSDAQCLASAENLARRTLETLLHTPVGGLGHNFEFVDENPAPAVLEVFTQAQQDVADIVPQGWVARSGALATAFAVDGRTVNVQRSYKDGKLIVKFNFHHAVPNAASCAAVLRQEHGEASMLQNLDIAKQLIVGIYGGLDEENEPEASA